MPAPANTARLVPVEDGAPNFAAGDIQLGAGRLRLGRAPESHVVLNDREVSKHHAEVEWTEEGWVVRDLGSSNGTYVNGEAVEVCLLQGGDVVELGTCRYRLVVGGDDGAEVTLSPAGAPDSTRVIVSAQVGGKVDARLLQSVDDLRSHLERSQTAFQAVQSLIETTDITALCRRILEVTFKLVKANTGSVMLFDQHHELVPWAHHSTLPPGTDPRTISRTLVDRVIREKSAVLAADALADSRFSSSRSIVMSGVRSLMCVPLLNGERIFGILHVGNSAEVGAFSAADLELLSGIATGAGVALSNAFLAHQLAEEARTRDSLGRFLSPQLVEQVVNQQIKIERGGDERPVTVMFADIRGFTSLTERTAATEVVSLLNEYFEQMVEVVFSYGGTLDKFIGDALMAVWGSPLVHPSDAANAVEAACDMQRTVDSVNAWRHDRGLSPIGVGIGLASGVCVAGAIGARRRMEFTVIGDAVNLASRLSSVAQAGEVIIDDATYRSAGEPEAERLPPAMVKGKHRPVEIYRVWPPRSA